MAVGLQNPAQDPLPAAHAPCSICLCGHAARAGAAGQGLQANWLSESRVPMLHAETHTPGPEPSGLLHACILMHVHECECRWDYAIEERDAEITELKRRLVEAEHRAREAASKAAEELRVMGADLQVRRQQTCLQPLCTQTQATLSAGFSKVLFAYPTGKLGVRSCRLDMSG